MTSKPVPKVSPHPAIIPNLSPQIQQPQPPQQIAPPAPSPTRPSTGGQNAHPNPGVPTYHGGPEAPASDQAVVAEVLIQSQQPYRH